MMKGLQALASGWGLYNLHEKLGVTIEILQQQFLPF